MGEFSFLKQASPITHCKCQKLDDSNWNCNVLGLGSQSLAFLEQNWHFCVEIYDTGLSSSINNSNARVSTEFCFPRQFCLT